MAISEYRAPVFMSWGMWVAICPKCGSAEKCGRCDDGSMGGLESERFICRENRGGCGFRCGADWPPAIENIERVLLARPNPMTRNWKPGELLSDLINENVRHGIFPTGPHEVVGNEVIDGALDFVHHLELEG